MQEVGPIFFSGEGEEYENLTKARAAAALWISKQGNKNDLQIKSQIVGCL
tara:strand:+ start:424 stop:573 length:150 start_codon:yes stop_codon:yes gene_type:complete